MIGRIAAVTKLSGAGPESSQQISHRIEEGVALRIGRSPSRGFAISSDRRISREHADVLWQGESLRITCLPQARKPLIIKGEEARSVTLPLHEAFRIGDTVIQIQDVQGRPPAARQFPQFIDDETEAHATRHSFQAEFLQQAPFGDTRLQMAALAELPRLIAESTSDELLAWSLVKLLLQAIPSASAAAVVQYDITLDSEPDWAAFDASRPAVMRVETRDDFLGRFLPSKRLLTQALKTGESVVQIWSGNRETDGEFTMTGGLDWAFCTPLTAEYCRGWCLYVSGTGAPDNRLLLKPDDFRSDVRFTVLVAQFLGAIRQVRVLHEQRTQLSSFFSPKVIENLTRRDTIAALAPSERDVTVLFCDVRGFSRKSEELQNELLTLLNSVREALGAMAEGILEHDGAIADFQGDSAMGFWGWPLPTQDGPLPACRAALRIVAEFRNELHHSLLAGFSVGIGIAHGRAIAGQVGTVQQAKIGVFGPVVNQGARIEGLTRHFDVSICLDERSADSIRGALPPELGVCRLLGRVRPYGMQTPLTISELIPGYIPHPLLVDRRLEEFEAAVRAVIDGRWAEGRKLLVELPDDGPRRFLLNQMLRFGNQPPDDWDGAFNLQDR